VVDALPLALSPVAQHLTVLKNAGVIPGTVDGPRRCYGVDPRAIERLRRYVNAL
jgi:ArsR family transcriptional regulator